MKNKKSTRRTFLKDTLATASGLLAVPTLIFSKEKEGDRKVVSSDIKPDTLTFEPFVWQSEIPEDCPFQRSEAFNAIKFMGQKSGFIGYGDTWYPTWALDDKLYSLWTEGGKTKRLDGYTDFSHSGAGPYRNTSGQGIIVGSDPMSLKAYSIGTFLARSNPYMGRYPCGSLLHDGVWYYGTYCLGPQGRTEYGNLTVNWPWLGPFVGFRYSTDFGRSWTEGPHTPSNPIFGETGINGYPVKIGAPHFVDFGKNMEHSPGSHYGMVFQKIELLNK